MLRSTRFPPQIDSACRPNGHCTARPRRPV